MSGTRMPGGQRADGAALQLAGGLRQGIARLASWMAHAAGWNYIACAAFIATDVVARGVFGVSSAATVEITSYMLAAGISWSLAHTLAMRAHIRVDVLVNRMPLRVRATFHVLSILMLSGFAGFLAWAGWSLLDESMLFGAHDGSGLHIPMWLPQGLWFAGLVVFLALALALSIESLVALLAGYPDRVEALLSSRSVDDETDEALEAVAMVRKEPHA